MREPRPTPEPAGQLPTGNAPCTLWTSYHVLLFSRTFSISSTNGHIDLFYTFFFSFTYLENLSILEKTVGNQALGQSLLKMKCISLRSINFRENIPVFLNHFCSLQMDSNRKREERKHHRTQEQTNKSALGVSTLSSSSIFGFCFYSHFLFYLTGTTGVLTFMGSLNKSPF